MKQWKEQKPIPRLKRLVQKYYSHQNSQLTRFQSHKLPLVLKKKIKFQSFKNKKKIMQKKKPMVCKILPCHSFPSFKRILTACRELNQIARFTSIQSGFLIDCIDTFNHTQLSCELKATETSKDDKDKTEVQTHVDLETIVPLLATLSDRKRAIVIEFDNDTDVQIKDANLNEVVIVSSLKYLKDYGKCYSPQHSQQQPTCSFISMVVADIANILVNLSIVSGHATISLDSSGLLKFKNDSHIAKWDIIKPLRGFHSSTNQILANIHVIVKFVKVFITIAAWSTIPSQQKCTLEIPHNNENSNKAYVKIHFTLCSEAKGHFILCSQ